MNPTDFANRLREAREMAGMSQQAVAEALQLPRTAITQIEGGNRSVSTFELAKFAKLYRRAISYFFDNTSEKEEDIEVLLYRAAPNLKQTVQVKQQLNRTFDLCREGITLEKILGREIRLGPPSYQLSIPKHKGEAVTQGELIAEQERKRLGIGIGPIGDISDLIASQGIWVASTTIPDTMSGLFLNHPKTGLVILVNAHHIKARKRFSFAHEYAHALIDRDARDALIRISNTENHNEFAEVRANAFAAAFLMPTEGVFEFLRILNKGQPSRQEQIVFDVVTGGRTESESRTIPRSQNISYQDIASIAHRFGVSYEAAVYRLRNLNYFSQKDCKRLISQEDVGKKYLQSINMLSDLENKEDKKLWDRELRRQLVNLAVEAYRREEISRGRIFELGKEIGIGGNILFDLAEAIRS